MKIVTNSSQNEGIVYIDLGAGLQSIVRSSNSRAGGTYGYRGDLFSVTISLSLAGDGVDYAQNIVLFPLDLKMFLQI